MLHDFQPAIIVTGKLPGDGFVDAALRYLVERMPEYEHRFELASMARTQGVMTAGVQVCHPAMKSSAERESFIDFSETVHFGLNHHLIVRQDRLGRFSPYIDRDGKVDLSRLMADPSLTAAVTDQRLYAPVIDSLLVEHQGERHLLRTSIKYESSLNQVAAGWVDYTFAYPVEVGWYKSRGRLSSEVALAYVPIAGNPEFSLAVVACTRGAWGRRVVARVNQIVRAAGNRPPWIDVERALSDEEGARRLEAAFVRHNPFRR